MHTEHSVQQQRVVDSPIHINSCQVGTARHLKQDNKTRMVADILKSPTLNKKSRNVVQPNISQLQPDNNINWAVSVARESSILKLNTAGIYHITNFFKY